MSEFDDASQEVARAWKYLKGADDLVHSRINALLICHAFLLVAYAQIFVAANFAEDKYLQTLCLGISLLALVLTLFIGNGVQKLVSGGDALKSAYLIKADPAYQTYMGGVRGSTSGSRNWSFTRSVPTIFAVFWLLVLVHLAFNVFVTFK